MDQIPPAIQSTPTTPLPPPQSTHPRPGGCVVQRAAAVRARCAARRQQGREGHRAWIERGHHVGVHTAHAQPAHACRHQVRGWSGVGEGGCSREGWM